MKIRRVVAGTGAGGKSQLFSDAVAPRSVELKSLPGFAAALLWSTRADDTVGRGEVVDRSPQVGFAPAEGETRLMFVTFPPDAVMTRADFDAAAFGAEFAARVPGLAETFEPNHPGMHTTDSIDYDVVLEGEITLELDDGAQVLLRRHDVAVQHGNRHAWRNPGDRPATMLFVLIGTQRKE
ncbi:cupin domain-containing protein [Variovorax paradoxus]|nr:cupin domain-containing protein [Variovorax paradoxus]MBT2304897.1 cupin domain-containing protein [Variovorax paradoxus]